MKHHVWVTRLQTLDLVVDAESRDDAEKEARTRLAGVNELPWLTSATVIRTADASDETTDGPGQAAHARQVWTVPEAAQQLGVSRTTVYALIRDGELGSVTVGRRRFVADEQLHDYLRRQIDV